MQVHGDLPEAVAGALALKQQHLHNYVESHVQRPCAASSVPDLPDHLLAPSATADVETNAKDETDC